MDNLVQNIVNVKCHKKDMSQRHGRSQEKAIMFTKKNQVRLPRERSI